MFQAPYPGNTSYPAASPYPQAPYPGAGGAPQAAPYPGAGAPHAAPYPGAGAPQASYPAAGAPQASYPGYNTQAPPAQNYPQYPAASGQVPPPANYPAPQQPKQPKATAPPTRGMADMSIGTGSGWSQGGGASGTKQVRKTQSYFLISFFAKIL